MANEEIYRLSERLDAIEEAIAGILEALIDEDALPRSVILEIEKVKEDFYKVER